MPKYYEISEVAAKRAKDMNSFSDYKPGSATSAYRQMVDKAYAIAERQKARVDPMYHDKIDALVDRYAKKLAANLNEPHVIDGRVPSILIAGGGNFPVRKKEKQNAARDRNMGEYMEIEKLLDKIKSVGTGGISADDDLAVEKLTKKLEGMESQQAMMKAVNAFYRKHKTLEGCPELTAEQVEKLKASMSQDWRKDPVPFPAYLLTNNNANIRRVRRRIEELGHKTEFVGWTFPGGEAKVNEAENRLQLIFEDKPDADTRQALKSEGFKWAPSQGAWQRQLNQNAIRAAARLDFLRPEGCGAPSEVPARSYLPAGCRGSQHQTDGPDAAVPADGRRSGSRCTPTQGFAPAGSSFPPAAPCGRSFQGRSAAFLLCAHSPRNAPPFCLSCSVSVSSSTTSCQISG